MTEPTINFLRLADLSPEKRQQLLTRTEGDLSSYLEKLKPIIEAVRERGDEALAEFANHFDKSPVTADTIAATPSDFARAKKELEPDVVAAIGYAAANIRKFHEEQKPEEMWMEEISPGSFAGDRSLPIPSVACYIPRGKGAFPSSVMMTCIPASVAGVPDICIITPPGPDGHIDAATLVAAEAAGVSKVYKAGGAQGIAAVAFGTKTIGRYAKVVGPGSPWVVAAKRLLAGRIDTGTPAGPSEAIVFADGTTSGKLAALDLLIEAEHGPDSGAFIVTTSEEVARDALAAIPYYWKEMGEQRVSFTRAVLTSDRGGILIARDAEEAFAFINDYAPEHLQVLSKEPKKYLPLIRYAGEVLLGEYSPSTLANFVVGPSHVLPTGGWAKTFSALSVHDFMKRTSIVEVTRAAYASHAKYAGVIARYEGFDAHANAVSKLRDKLLGN
ncbi:histidinol dehydrogenase [Aestuariivirga sp.]|uniref:histidinol dehydrogenase n=1 Tax=Aestuariivirga sp. TaxID=2650926 RepID=UPI0039E56ED8